MGKIRWGWSKVRSGQVIKFTYGDKDRVIIVMMSPMDPSSNDKKLLHGLQIQDKGMGVGGMRTKLPLIIQKTSGVHFIREDKRTGKYFKFRMGFDSEDRVKPDNVYKQLKGLIGSKDLYKTFSWEKCRRGGVYLDNDELNEYNIPVDMLADAGVIPNEKIPSVKPKPKTFNRKQRQERRKPGDVWKRLGGKWAGKSLDKIIRAFDTEEQAEFWAESTSKNYKVRQVRAAKKNSKNVDEDEI
tara:strand:+ start:4073 stop:4795 length:723 start_codon:yes stop_codon:yes gene_type:complete